MGCRVIFTPQSLRDLRNIVRFIRRDSPKRAEQFGERLIDEGLRLESFPGMGRVVPEIAENTIREIAFGSYRIIYEFKSEREPVFILRFWHAARGVPDTNGSA